MFASAFKYNETSLLRDMLIYHRLLACLHSMMTLQTKATVTMTSSGTPAFVIKDHHQSYPGAPGH